eukprot:340938_1
MLKPFFHLIVLLSGNSWMSAKNTEEVRNRWLKLSKSKLIKKCKKHKISCCGKNKNDMIDALMNKLNKNTKKAQKTKDKFYQKQLLQKHILKSINIPVTRRLKHSNMIYTDGYIYKWNTKDKKWHEHALLDLFYFRRNTCQNVNIIGINKDNTELYIYAVEATDSPFRRKEIKKYIYHIEADAVKVSITTTFEQLGFVAGLVINNTMHAFGTWNIHNKQALIHAVYDENKMKLVTDRETILYNFRTSFNVNGFDGIYYDKLLNVIMVIYPRLDNNYVNGKRRAEQCIYFHIRYCNLDDIENLNDVEKYVWRKRNLSLPCAKRWHNKTFKWIIGFGTVLVVFDFKDLSIYYKDILDNRKDNKWYKSKEKIPCSFLKCRDEYDATDFVITSDNVVHMFKSRYYGRNGRYHVYFDLVDIAPKAHGVIGKQMGYWLVCGYVMCVCQKRNYFYGDVVQLIFRYYSPW